MEFGYFYMQNSYCTLFSKKADYETKTKKIMNSNYRCPQFAPVKAVIYRNI